MLLNYFRFANCSCRQAGHTNRVADWIYQSVSFRADIACVASMFDNTGLVRLVAYLTDGAGDGLNGLQVCADTVDIECTA